MIKPKFTEGPWTLNDLSMEYISIRSPAGDLVSEVHSYKVKDAMLICKAPELFHALSNLVGQIEQGREFHEIIEVSPSTQQALQDAKTILKQVTGELL